MNANLYALLAEHFPEGSEQECMIVTGGPVITYEELGAESARIANALVTAGCMPGDRIAVQADKHWQVVALYLACLRAGLIYLPLNTGYQKSELAYFFEDAKPRVIVCRGETLGVITKHAGNATVLTIDAHGGELGDRARAMSPVFATVKSTADDVAAIVYTSGTTGRPKGALLTHRNLASNALTLVDAWAFTQRDVLLHALPIYHIHGLFVALHCALLSGARMLWLAKFDAQEVLAHLPRASVLMGVPTFYTRLLAEPALTQAACSSLRLFVSGSAPLLPETFSDFRERTGHVILERYGMTETGMNTANPLSGERVAGTVGKPLPGVDLRITADDGTECAPGVVGGVQVKGPNVFAGYWQMPEKTREEFTADGYFKTGDVGEWVADGPGRGYVRLVGRAKDLIITGGLNVYPVEVEESINGIEGVVESAVVACPDPDFGEAVTAFVVGKPGHPLSEAAIIGALKGNIATFKVPKRVFLVTELPRNAMGKVQKNLLRERLAPAIPDTQP